jgi:hypothetical protein
MYGVRVRVYELSDIILSAYRRQLVTCHLLVLNGLLITQTRVSF